MFVAVLGHGHPESGLNAMHIGNVHQGQGRYEEALVQYGKAQEVFVAVYGSRHPQSAAWLNNMAVVCEGQGDEEKALCYYGKALDVFVAIQMGTIRDLTVLPEDPRLSMFVGQQIQHWSTGHPGGLPRGSACNPGSTVGIHKPSSSSSCFTPCCLPSRGLPGIPYRIYTTNEQPSSASRLSRTCCFILAASIACKRWRYTVTKILSISNALRLRFEQRPLRKCACCSFGRRSRGNPGAPGWETLSERRNDRMSAACQMGEVHTRCVIGTSKRS